MNKFWRWFHRWGAPPYFYQKTGRLIPIFLSLGLLGLVYGAVSGLWFAPADYQQKDAFRIIYVHVPAAITSLSIYSTMGVLSFVYLIWKVKIVDVLAQVLAPIGAGMTALALLTGSIWGKPMWGTWWVWDARLTSELILLFLYFGYMGLRSALEDSSSQAKACAILAVIGVIDVPIIHYSVEWWQTLHQGPTISQFAKPSMAKEMLTPLLGMLFGFYCYIIALSLYNARSELLFRERYTRWVQTVVNE